MAHNAALVPLSLFMNETCLMCAQGARAQALSMRFSQVGRTAREGIGVRNTRPSNRTFVAMLVLENQCRRSSQNEFEIWILQVQICQHFRWLARVDPYRLLPPFCSTLRFSPLKVRGSQGAVWRSSCPEISHLTRTMRVPARTQRYVTFLRPNGWSDSEM